ncbi:MAG: c-type cytochrome [Saprospiraceae bacterium]|nr:c-type cytochrome [Saprospiraceae bacterium]
MLHFSSFAPWSRVRLFSAFLLAAPILFIACKDGPEAPATDEREYNAGGATTVFGEHSQVFQQPASNLTAQEVDEHFKADANFEAIFVTAPATIQGGLGPLFNQTSCSGCHIRNGRAVFPASPADDPGGLLFRLSLPGEGSLGESLEVPGFGGQLQTKSVFGKQPEGRVSVQFIEELVQFVDGEKVALRKPVFVFNDLYAAFPANGLISPRIAPPVFGLGLLEAIPETAVLAHADENDADGDGISGKPNYVWNVATQSKGLGRFGWKAGQPTLLQQTAAAYNGDMGVTTTMFQQENCTGQPQCDDLADDPEVDLETLKSTAFYTQSLAVPAARNLDDPDVQRGKKIFTKVKCGACHTPSFTTGAHPEYDFLSGQLIFPFTDLLLHDMGEGLADNRPDHRADGREWRTPPLWGIGLTQTVSGHTNFLHDGRARNLTEAILWHGGEAESARQRVLQLSAGERNALLAYLQSL